MGNTGSHERKRIKKWGCARFLCPEEKLSEIMKTTIVEGAEWEQCQFPDKITRMRGMLSS